MSDSGFSGLPPRTGTGMGELSYPPSRADLKAKIIEMRGKLKAQKVQGKIDGEIIKHNKDGTTRIHTDKGEITVKIQSKEPPPEGAKVQLDIPAGHPPRHLTVLAAPQEKPAPVPHAQPAPTEQIELSAQAQEVKTGTTEQTNAATKADALKELSQTVQPLQKGDVVRLTLFSGEKFSPVNSDRFITPSFLPPSLPSPAVKTGTAATSSILSMLKTITGSLSRNHHTSMTAPLLHNLYNAATEDSTGLIKTTTALDVKITNISTKSGALSTAGLKPNEITGHIIGQEAHNLPVLSLFLPGTEQSSLFTIQFNAGNLPAGTTLTFIPQAAKMPAGQISAPPSSPRTLAQFSSSFMSSFTWPAFEELAQTLQHLAPQALHSLTQTVPNPANPARIAPAILFFVAAIRSGDIQSWLGDKAIDTLRKNGKSDLLSRLGRDISNLSRLSSEPLTQEWRTLSLPLYWQGDIHKMQLYYRHDHPHQQEERDQEKLKGTRFIFDLNLERMGPVQLDGLHRPQESGGRLDLVVRTENALSPVMQSAMRKAYINALIKAGVTGEISFQGSLERFIKIENTEKTIGVSV